MKKKMGFWQSLEEYGRKTIDRSPLPRYWPWIGAALVVVIVVASLMNRRDSTAGARSMREVIIHAAERGDYQLAQTLFEQNQELRFKNEVLGVESELEEMVYPESVVSKRISEIEEKLLEYPESKAIYLILANLYGQLDNTEMESEYREKARILDPNGAEFR